MTKFIELSEETFAALFKPTANHLNPNASFDWSDGCGTLFETFGEELAHVQKQHPANIWTHCSGDGDFLVSGFHVVNRLGYFITEVPVPDGVQVQVPLDAPSGQPLPSRIAAKLRTVIDYLWDDEQRHYLESEPCDRQGHIFRPLKAIRTWLETAATSTDRSSKSTLTGKD
jgi:hypothetical protein